MVAARLKASSRRRGWAQDASAPERPVLLDMVVGGALACSVLANGYRADLRRAGLGSGCHAFTVTLPAGLAGAAEDAAQAA